MLPTEEKNLTRQESIKGYAQVNGINMYYEIHGEGEPLVLIHGGGSTIQTTFGRILPLLAMNNKVIAVELQGHGHTNDRDAPESFEQDAKDVAALLGHLRISKASVFGFSNGGNTAIQLVTRFPGIADKLILASAFYKREGMIPGFFEGMKEATLDVMPRVLKDAFLEINPDSNKLQAMFNKDKARMLEFKDWEDELLRSIKIPTLIISSDHDVILPAHAVTMSTLIANSSLAILPGLHGAYIGVAEVPETGGKIIELTAELINHFLNSEDRR